MKNYIHILTLAAVMCASLVGASCSREDLPKVVAEPEYTRVELAFDMGAMQTRADATAEQGDQISDVTVWAYRVTSGSGTTATVEQTPVGWGTKTFTNTYASTSSAPFYFELPYSASEAQTFRFVAVINKDAFGSILEPQTASGQPTLTLGETSSYTDLTHAVFQADALMEDYPTSNTPASMPVSHWQDFTIDAGTTDLTGANAKSMNVYRAVAKTQLNARLASTSSSGAALRITSVEIKSASGGASQQGYAIPSQGFMFSDIADLAGSQAAPNPTPSAFGDYQDVATAIPSISLKNTAATGNGAATFTAKAVTAMQSTNATATYDIIGSAFLYENHHTTTGIPSTTSPDAYAVGTYYMEINYEYGQATTDSSDTDGIVDATIKTATNYVPLPSVVRNRDYQVNATFEVNLAGAVQLAYEVVDWYDGGTTTLDFSYPTFMVEAAQTDDNGNPVYSKPEAYYNSTNKEEGAFTFKLTITGPLNTTPEKEYTITHEDNDGFAVKAYKVTNDNPMDSTEVDNSTISITASTDHYYLIKVYPTDAMPTGEVATAPTCSVGITHEASWTGTSEYLLINIGDNNGRKWSDSGDDSHLIKVTQIAAPTNP